MLTEILILSLALIAVAVTGTLMWRHRRDNQQLREQQLKQQAVIDQLSGRLQLLQQLDLLTQLPNRQAYFNRLEHALRRAKRRQRKMAVVVLDLINLKQQLSRLGQSEAEEQLKLVAAQLQGLIRETDTLARLGSDEFAFVFEDLSSVEDCRQLCGRIIDLLPEGLEGRIGIAIAPDQSDQSEPLLTLARLAVTQARLTSEPVVLSDGISVPDAVSGTASGSVTEA